MSIVKEAWSRLKGETPYFFKKVGAASLAAGSAGVAMLGIQAGLNMVTPAGHVPPHVPDIITTLGSHFMVGGAIGKVIASFACMTPPDNTPKA